MIVVASAATEADWVQPMKKRETRTVDGRPATTPPALVPNLSARTVPIVIQRLPATNESISLTIKESVTETCLFPVIYTKPLQEASRKTEKSFAYHFFCGLNCTHGQHCTEPLSACEVTMATIRVKSKKDEGHTIVSPSGVWGGVTPQGMIYFDMFLEKPEPPAETTITMDERTGQRTETVNGPTETFLERLLLVGILVHPDVARSVGQWLIEKADEARLLGHQSGPANFVQ